MNRSGLKPGRAGMSPRVLPARECGVNVDAAEISATRPFGVSRNFASRASDEAVADAGFDQAGLADVAAGDLRAERAEIAGVIVRARDEVESRPHQLFQDRRIGPHPGAAAFVRGRRLVIVEQRLEIRERRVGAANQIEEPGELGLFEHREALHDDRVAGQRQRERLIHLRGTPLR